MTVSFGTSLPLCGAEGLGEVPSGAGSKQHATGNLNPLSVDRAILVREQRRDHWPDVIWHPGPTERSHSATILLRTGLSILDQEKVGFALGAADYLIKPIRKPVLLEAIWKHLPLQSSDDSEILLVDDDPRTLELLEASLRLAGYEKRGNAVREPWKFSLPSS
jgi:CheY-like chemotaxis protein